MVTALNIDLAAFFGASSSEVVSEYVNLLDENMNLAKRAEVVAAFRTGEVRVLLATDIASRGLDVPEISHVIQFDLPSTAAVYLHRAGRTGRMGRPGVVVTLGAESESFIIDRLGNALSISIARMNAGASEAGAVPLNAAQDSDSLSM